MKKAILMMIVLSAIKLIAADGGIAVWNPDGGTKEPSNRFRLLQEKLDQTAAWLTDAKFAVTRLTAEQIADPSVFSMQKFDVLVMPGDSFPKNDLDAIRKFTGEGGILIGLDSLTPFLVRMEQDKDKNWKLSPSTPAFAWQTQELMSQFGIRYLWKPELHDGGMVHSVASAFASYLPEKASVTPMRSKVMGRWLVTEDGATFYPLIESKRLDGQEVVPDIFIARKGKATAILCTTGIFTNAATEGAEWSFGRETVVAMVKLATDLSHGKIDIGSFRQLKIPENAPLPEPLRMRDVKGKVEPEAEKPLARWGQFDGSSLELGALVKSKQAVEVSLNAESGSVPRGLESGASLRLQLPDAAQDGAPRFLRIRGAYNRGGAGLCVSQEKTILWNEQLSYIDAQGDSNFGTLASGEPIEFNRIIFLPPGQDKNCEIRNIGESNVYFDAIQVEKRTGPGREWIIGLGVFDKPPFAVSTEISQTWPCIRAPLRFERVGPPGDADRWKSQEELLGFYKGICPRIHALIQNTPGWAAISEERLKEATKGNRARDVAPDPKKYGEMLEYFLKNNSKGISSFELWNEPELKQFFWGTREESIELFKVMAPMIRRLRPDATIIGPGFAGHDMKGWLSAMKSAGVLDCIDLMAVHCYAGKTQAWDRIALTYQGELYALGVEKPIYANEQGIPWKNAQWFQPPPAFTPWIQGIYTNTGLARLAASSIEKINVFMAYNPHDPVFDLFDAQGRPRPGYFAVKDYMELCRNEGRRLDVSMASQDGKPLAGVYAAAAVDSKGAVTLILNPAEVERLLPPKEVRDCSTEFNDKGEWNWFQGKAAIENGKAVLTIDKDKQYMGFSSPVTIDLEKNPIMEVVVAESEKPWSLGIRTGKSEVNVTGDGKQGTNQYDLRDFTSGTGVLEGEITFRVKGRTVFDAVRFLPVSAAGPAKPVKLFTAGSGHSFSGKAENAEQGLKLTPEQGKDYVGYNTDVAIDLVRRPFLEVVVPECEKSWNLTVKINDKQTTLAENAGKGTIRIDLREKLPDLKTATCTLTLRAFGPTLVQSVQLLPEPNAVPAPVLEKPKDAVAKPIPVIVRFPLAISSGNAVWKRGEATGKIPVKMHEGKPGWAEISIELSGRTVLVAGRTE